MSDLIKILNIAVERKPKVSEPCNYCGYCCIAEVCVVGQEITGKTIGPCLLLSMNHDTKEHKCSLVEKAPEIMAEIIGTSTGCCAETQEESINRIIDKSK